MKELKVNSIPLWRMSSLTRLITSTARLQGFLVIFAGLLFIPAAVYEKYQEDNSKIYRLAIYTPLATACVLAPTILYRRNVKRILQSIDYAPSENLFHLQTYKNELLQVPVSKIQFKCNPQKPKIIHELVVVKEGEEGRVFKIEGYGEWESAELFKYIVEKDGLRE